MVLIKSLGVNNRVQISPRQTSISTTFKGGAIGLHFTQSGAAGFGDDQGPGGLRMVRITEGKSAIGPGHTAGTVNQVVSGTKGTVIQFYSMG